MMVIIAALATEQCGRLSIRPLDLLKGFTFRLSSSASEPNLPLFMQLHTLTSGAASVKDACLLAMLRLAADCDEIPSSVITVVRELGNQSKRHLRQVRLTFEVGIKTLMVT